MKYLSYRIRNKNLKTTLNTLLGFIMLFIMSCGNKSDTSAGAANATDTVVKDTVEMKSPDISKAGEVSISKQQHDAINISLGDFEKKNLANVLKTTGNLSVPPQSKASITSTLGGTVKAIFVEEGANVNKGQALLTIVNPEFVKMQQEYLDARSQLSLANANYTRQQTLAKENVTSKRALQEAESSYNSLMAKANSLKSQFNLIGINASQVNAGNIISTISVRSPIKGTVAKINVNLGLTLDPSTTLMEVVDNSHLHLDLFVYEQDLPKVKIGQNVDFSLTNLPGQNFEAKIYSIGSAFENETKSIPIHAEIKGYRKELIEGMNVTGLINIGQSLNTAIPTNAIVSFSGEDYIFIQKQVSTDQNKGEFTFKRIRVKKGITSGVYTEVTPLEATPDNSKVVTNGSYYLMAILTNAGEE